MSDYQYKKQLPTPEEYKIIRHNVGWSDIPIETVEESLQLTIFGVSVYDNGNIIGAGRIVGDKGLCFYIQDVMVHTEYQHQGVGTKIVTMLMDYIKKHAVQNSFVALMSAKGLENFYGRFGFNQRPNNEYGAGMMQIWDKSK